MKKIKLIIFLIIIIFSSSCIKKDPLLEIKRMARSSMKKKPEEQIADKKAAVKQYELAIDTLVNAYINMGSLNKEVGERLMFRKDYNDAIKHLEIAKDIRNDDAEIYHWLGVCNVNLYKVGNNMDNLLKAEEYYETALRISPNYKEAMYSYSHLLFYGKQDYEKAIEILKKYIFETTEKQIKNKKEKIQSTDPKAYFLLARAYYTIGEYKKAYEIYTEIENIKKYLTKDEKEKLKEFIIETQRMISDESTTL